MKCNICGNEINGYGNNPYPICLQDDVNPRCCNNCNEKYVISARLLQFKGVQRPIKQGDLIVVFCSKNSDKPLTTLLETGRMLAGEATDNEALPKGCCEGSWGNFLLNEETDSYIIIEK